MAWARLSALVMISGCSDALAPTPDADAASALVKVDGSSTAFPISQAVVDGFRESNSDLRITLGVSGTAGGLRKLCLGEVDVVSASRLASADELSLCRTAGLDWLELPFAFDGISVVVHPSTTWVNHLTLDELRTIWRVRSQGRVMNWSQVRAGFPDEPLYLMGPGPQSGTFDIFSQALLGRENRFRIDYSASEDDHHLVHRVATKRGSLSFFGYGYYWQNRQRLKLLAIKDGGKKAILPTPQSIADGSYQPLSRALYLYVSRRALTQSHVRQFVDYYLNHGALIAARVGSVSLSPKRLEAARAKLERAIKGLK
ncbi:MAG: phosphate ABC transporter substrate-binding protein PstS family protein [Myxococcota bacterium]|nr:phosphate ABC transporter substrate-binding protein PstS family protein [Myxococcota bacterium]